MLSLKYKGHKHVALPSNEAENILSHPIKTWRRIGLDCCEMFPHKFRVTKLTNSANKKPCNVLGLVVKLCNSYI